MTRGERQDFIQIGNQISNQTQTMFLQLFARVILLILLSFTQADSAQVNICRFVSTKLIWVGNERFDFESSSDASTNHSQNSWE